MTCDPAFPRKNLPAPCIIDAGTVVNKQDMQRLLQDLDRVRYIHSQDGEFVGDGEGRVLDVFADPQRATLIANHTLYLNVESFDYLEIGRSPTQETWINLVQDGRQLRLIPLSNPMDVQPVGPIDTAELEAMVAEVLSASLDARFDDEEHFLF